VVDNATGVEDEKVFDSCPAPILLPLTSERARGKSKKRESFVTQFLFDDAEHVYLPRQKGAYKCFACVSSQLNVSLSLGLQAACNKIPLAFVSDIVSPSVLPARPSLRLRRF
jgi:hypothetical protein